MLAWKVAASRLAVLLGGMTMRNWRVLSLVFVCVAAVLVWQMLPTPATPAQMMKLPPGASLRTLNTIDAAGMPGIKKVTYNRFELKPGAKWPDFMEEANHWDFCYIQAGQLTAKLPDGKIVVRRAGDSYLIKPGTKAALSNNGSVTVVDLFWEFEVQ